MKKLTSVLSLLLCLLLLIGCGANNLQPSTPTEEEQWIASLNETYEAYLPDLGNRREQWDAVLSKCTPEETLIMKYYFVCMPMCDVTGIDFELLHQYASHAQMLRETMPWTKDVSYIDFMKYVAAYRISDEPIDDHRSFFFDQMKDMIDGKTAEEAALQVNLWCGMQATYSESDMRNASPMGMYNGGYGRCGEEASFAVNALRSVGFPARVVAVDWSVVDGNHAFAQMLVDGEWMFFGACEPEGVLNNGWFTDRLGTAVSISSYRINGTTSTLENVTSLFVETKQVSITVLDKEGNPSKGRRVDLIIMGPSSYPFVIATLYSDENGKVSYETGLGSFIAVSYDGDDVCYTCVSPEQTDVTISFAQSTKDSGWQAFAITNSTGKIKNAHTQTWEQRTAFFGDISVDDVRNANRLSKYDANKAALYPECAEALITCGRNFDEVIAFLSVDDDPMRSALVNGLSDKDIRELTADVMEDLLQGAEAVRGDLGDEEFVNCLLLPIMDNARPTAHRRWVQEHFTNEQLELFRADPQKLSDWFYENVSSESIRPDYSIASGLKAVLESGYCPSSYTGEAVLQLARAIGIPLMWSEIDGMWMYSSEGEWEAVTWTYPQTEGEGTEYLFGVFRVDVSGNEPFIGDVCYIALCVDNDMAILTGWQHSEDDSSFGYRMIQGRYLVWMIDMQDEYNGTLYMRTFTLGENEEFTLPLPQVK